MISFCQEELLEHTQANNNFSELGIKLGELNFPKELIETQPTNLV
jgi:hypothetical protein